MDKPNPPAPESFLPLKPVVLHILLALAERKAHGYGVIRAVKRQSEGRVRLETGPFYRHLRVLMDSGLVDETDWRPTDDDRRRGAYYTLTALGRQVVAAEGIRLMQVVTTTERLGLLKKEG